MVSILVFAMLSCSILHYRIMLSGMLLFQHIHYPVSNSDFNTKLIVQLITTMQTNHPYPSSKPH